MSKDIIVCVDAGGTTSKVGVFTKDGNVLVREIGKAGSPAVDKNWYLNIDLAIQKALDKLDFEYNILHIELGVSGISAVSDHKNIDNYFINKYHTSCDITSDTLTALYSVINENDDEGIVVISGTGIAVFGKQKNNTHLIGGWGHLIREHGSAYAIVHDFVVSIIDKVEALIPLDELDNNFLNYCEIKDIREFNHLFYQHSKDEIATYSIFFKEEANKNNERAKQLLKEQGIKLGIQVKHIMQTLNIKNGAKIGLKGGFIEHDGKYIVDGIFEYLDKNNINLNYVNNHEEQLKGVYRVAMRHINEGLK